MAFLDAGKKLQSQDLVEQVKVGSLTAYKKIDFFQVHRNKILRFAKDPVARKRVATKRRPANVAGSQQRIRIDIKVPKRRICAQQITIDDVDSFDSVRLIQEDVGYTKISETNFKNGVAKILREPGSFKDWGGENRDLITTRFWFKGRRRSAAFAFKGPGMPGKLTPGKMGKNGDQIQRLLRCPADAFFVQY